MVLPTKNWSICVAAFAASVAMSFVAVPDASACGVVVSPFGGGDGPSSFPERKPRRLAMDDHYVLVASERLMIPVGVVLEAPHLPDGANAVAQITTGHLSAPLLTFVLSAVAPGLPTAWREPEPLP